MATQHYSIVKHSFSMTKKESLIEDCIVVFLAETFFQIVDEVVTVKEEKMKEIRNDLDGFFSQKHHYTIFI